MPPSEFKENAESLNTAESVQVDVNPSLTKTELDAFASLLEVEIPGTWARSERNALIAAYITAARRLFAEVESRGRAIEALSARLTAKNTELDKTIQGMLNAGAEWAEKIGTMRAERDEALREAAADKAKLAAVRKIKAQRRNSAMVTSEQLATMHGWNDAVNAIREALEPCECGMTDPSTWEMHGGATEPGSAYEWNPDCPAHGDAPDAAPEMPRPPAEEADALAKHEAAIAEYVRACKADGCSCYPIASNTKVISHWCRIHGVLSIVPAELTWTNPGIRGGEPCMRGTRVPVEQICTLLEDGATWEFVKETYPSIPTPEGHREATQPGADGTDTSPAGSGRGTGVTEAQASDG